MARHSRIEMAGYTTHVMARGIDGSDVFRNDSDREEFVSRFAVLLDRTVFRCIGWCLMPNHYHLLVRSGGARLEELMRPLNGGYARWFNKKYERRGYLFQDRFKSLVCQNLDYALELIRYVHLNPLRAGLVSGLEGLSVYRWSGHRALCGSIDQVVFQDTRSVLTWFGGSTAEAREAYLRFIGEGIDASGMLAEKGPSHDASRKQSAPIGLPGIVGDPEFVKRAVKALGERRLVGAAMRAAGWNVNAVVAYVAHELGLEPSDLLRRGHANARARARYAAMFLCTQRLGIPAVSAGRTLGMQGYAASRAVHLGRAVVEELGLNLPDQPEKK